MKIDIFKKVDGIKNKKLKHRLLDKILDFNIPFNKPLKFKIQELSKDMVQIHSPSVKARQNHIKGAHACALATLGEYPAGLVLAQNFSPQKYRFILKDLNMSYEKQGRGALTAICKISAAPSVENDDESWHEMITVINNAQGELVATCKTNWQIKDWSKVKSKSHKTSH